MLVAPMVVHHNPISTTSKEQMADLGIPILVMCVSVILVPYIMIKIIDNIKK